MSDAGKEEALDREGTISKGVGNDPEENEEKKESLEDSHDKNDSTYLLENDKLDDEVKEKNPDEEQPPTDEQAKTNEDSKETSEKAKEENKEKPDKENETTPEDAEPGENVEGEDNTDQPLVSEQNEEKIDENDEPVVESGKATKEDTPETQQNNETEKKESEENTENVKNENNVEESDKFEKEETKDGHQIEDIVEKPNSDDAEKEKAEAEEKLPPEETKGDNEVDAVAERQKDGEAGDESKSENVPNDAEKPFEETTGATAENKQQEDEPEADNSAEKQPAADDQVQMPEGPVENKEQECGELKQNDEDKISPRVDVEASVAPPADNVDSTEETTATVKFLLMPSGQVSTKRCRLAQTISNIKVEFAKELKIPSSVIVLLLNTNSLKDDTTLGELVNPNGIIQIEMTSSDPLNAPLKDLKKQEEYQMPDILTVRVQRENGENKDVVVEIERSVRKKAYLGGFRHKKTGIEYHNAASQTIPKSRPPHPVERFCRDTQTHQFRHQVQQTNNTTSTQMTKVGCYTSNTDDKLVSPGKYITADEFHKKRFEKVVLIQKYYRRWLAKRYVERVKDDKEKRLEWERKEELKKKKEKEDRVKREYERRMNPKTKQDFDLLYHALEKWRQEEVEKINATLEGAERKAALCQLMEQQTELITSVGRHKLSSDVAKRGEIIQNLLDKASSPKKWKGPDGQITEMDTPYTLRAQELRDIYNSVTMKYLTQDERLDVLLTLKHTVKEHDCKLTREIVELIDREADLLMRGVKEANLDGLRKRISTLFLQYIKTPTFNPEIARHLKVPQDASSLRGNVFFCPSCKQYLPSTEFPLSSKASMGACRRCRATDNISRTRHDYSYYRSMLSSLRKAEEMFKDGSQIAFLLQDSDLRYLVENIWNGQSALSAWDDLYDLVLVRWIRDEHWSPWNCVLLTKEEAAAHEKLERLEEAYGKAMMHKVHQRHTIARNYFSRLPSMAESLKRLHPPKKYEEKKEKILQPRVSSVKLEA